MSDVDQITSSILHTGYLSRAEKHSCGYAFSLSYLIARKCVNYVHEEGFTTEDPVILGTNRTIDHVDGVAALLCPVLHDYLVSDTRGDEEEDGGYPLIGYIGNAVEDAFKNKSFDSTKEMFSCFDTLAFCANAKERKLYRFGCDAAMAIFSYDDEVGEIDYINPDYI